MRKAKYIFITLLFFSITLSMSGATQEKYADTTSQVLSTDTTVNDLLDEAALELNDTTAIDEIAEGGAYTQLKTKFIDGGAGFMSLVAIVLILGLACCIERIVYLSMSEIDAKKFMQNLENKLNTEGVDAAKELCRNTRGPVASICYQGLLRIKESSESIERSVSSYASVQVGNMEKGCSWITLFIAMAPSLGFLGTVIGMVISFENIEMASDINPTIVASGMKVALITTIFGIITAIILQLFYNYILSKIDHLTAQMEESAITLMDILNSKKA
ncbi:MAG: MotA/TolQ/ExbB proton channel family protein [Prevotella sp.]|nr:MotA/TolQ/ExbB proton channel family protein [Candidatus Prevotella equi]